MNVKKTIKKIAAIAIGTAMLGSTMLSASATLDQYPAPFVANGMANVQLVIGSGSTDDYLGALDIATSLQAASVSSVAVSGAASTATISGGYDLSGSDEFYLGDDIAADLDDTELPKLLAEGTIEYDGSEYDTTQALSYGATEITWDEEDNEPVLKLDIEGSDDPLWTYTFTVDSFEASNEGTDEDQYAESFSIEMLGKTFTVPADQSGLVDNELKIFGSDMTTYMELNTPKTVTVDGKSYTLEIVGANSDGDVATLIMDVNGVRKTVEEGNSYAINGLDVYVDDLFVTNIPTLSASANVFVGSNEIILDDASKVIIDDKAVDGLTAEVTFDDDVLESIVITYDPADLDEDVAGFDETNFLESGDSIKDPLFGTFATEFVGPNLELTDAAKTKFEVTTPSDDLQLVFETENGKVTLVPYNVDDAVLQYYAEESTLGDKGFVGPTDAPVEKNIFILHEAGDQEVTKVYEVKDVDADDGVELYDLALGKSITVKEGKEIADTDVYVQAINEEDNTFDLGNMADSDDEDYDTVLSDDYVTLKGGKQTLTIGTPEDGAATIQYDEVSIATDLADDDLEAQIVIDVDAIEDDDVAEVTIAAAPTEFTAVSSKDAETSNYLSTAGSYVVADDDKEFVTGYAVTDEDNCVEYSVFVAPEGAVVSTTATGSTTDKVNPIAVGVAVRDADVNIANPSKNLIVIGGTCINSVSAKLKNVAANTCGEASGLKPGEATIELFTLDNGKVAMLVAGWEAVDTQAAARAVATKAPGLTGNKVTLSVTSANQYTIKQ